MVEKQGWPCKRHRWQCSFERCRKACTLEGAFWKNSISENSSPKGSFWRNKRNPELSDLSSNSPYLQAVVLNVHFPRDGRAKPSLKYRRPDFFPNYPSLCSPLTAWSFARSYMQGWLKNWMSTLGRNRQVFDLDTRALTTFLPWGPPLCQLYRLREGVWQHSLRLPVEDIKALWDSIKAGKCHQDALQRLQVSCHLQYSTYRRLPRDHEYEATEYCFPLSVYLGDRLGFETSD